MKLLKRVSVLAVLITVIAVFAGCGKEATVVGTWEGDDYTYTFNDDGTGIQQMGEISVSITSYEAKDGKLSITISFLGTEETDEYTYSIKKNVLSLSDGNNTIELNKKQYFKTFALYSGAKVFF